MNLKFITIVFAQIILFTIPQKVMAQEISGIVKSKSSTIYFEDFELDKLKFDGDIKSNLAGSKYTFELKTGNNSFEGTISDKLSKFTIDLEYNRRSIEGEIKRNLNQTREDWNLIFFEKKLNGTVKLNASQTANTYDLVYGDKAIKGTIKKRLNTYVYNLSFGDKDISGTVSLNATTIKHSYDLKANGLNEDEMFVFLFIETIKLMNEHKNEVEDFQNDK